MKVVGGTYLEQVEMPSDVELGGSGLRAARALLGWRTDVELVSCVDDSLKETALSVSAATGLRATWFARDRAITYHYLNPLFVPVQSGRGAVAELPDVEAKAALAFGMVECQPTIRAEALVYDVQGVVDLDEVAAALAGSQRVALLANSRELTGLAGIDDPRNGARALRKRLGVEAVVCKYAARGVIVADERGTHHVGPYPTETVWPIGSGDVFAAGFAHAWLSGAKARHAARRGSFAASRWCSTRRLGAVAAQQTTPKAPPLPKPGKVYLAGPFFDLGQRMLLEDVRDALRDLGADVFSPLHDVGVGGPEAGAMDLLALRECTSVLALLDGHDPGTILECGWARHAGTPVVGYAHHIGREANTMLVASGAELHNDLPSAVYRAIWAGAGVLP
jgi:hypothetical protein